MSELRNNTQIIDLLFHTHIAAHIRTLACHTRSLKYVFYMLIAKLLPSQSIFMHLEYKNDHTYFLAFTATVFLNHLKFENKNKLLPF